MADNNVKWIKFIVGTFDGQSFKRIKRASIGGVDYRDKLTSVWFELLDLAAKCNKDGFFVDNNELAYKSLNDIAIMIDRKQEELELCMAFYIQEKMIEIVDDCYCLANWTKYQNNAGLKSIQEYNKEKQQECRKRKKEKALSLTVIDCQESSSLSLSKSNTISLTRIEEYFNTLWELYPKGKGKEQAIKNFEHKFRGLNEKEAKDKANKIYLLLKEHLKEWEEKNTEKTYIPNFGSWLTAEIPNSPKFNKRNR